MALSDVTFTIEKGGLGRPLPGKDHYTGLVSFIPNASLPAGFSTSDRVKQVGSLADAEALGITADSAVQLIKELHYTLKRLFGKNPKALVWIGLYDNTAIDYGDVTLFQQATNGECRQIGVLDTATTLATATIDALQTVAAGFLATHEPAWIIYAGNTQPTALASLPDLTSLTDPYVSCVIGQDGDGDGAALATASGNSMPALGDLLGITSKAKVHESIAYVEAFPLVAGGTGSDAGDLDNPAFGNGDLYLDQSVATLEGIENKGYIFVRKYKGLANSYFNKMPTAVSAADDLSKGYAVRTIHKAIRGVYEFLVPKISTPVYLDTDGKLSPEAVDTFNATANQHILQMIADGELSAGQVLVDPDQNVAATSTVAVAIEMVPVGVAEQITVKIGFVVSLS